MIWIIITILIIALLVAFYEIFNYHRKFKGLEDYNKKLRDKHNDLIDDFKQNLKNQQLIGEFTQAITEVVNKNTDRFGDEIETLQDQVALLFKTVCDDESDEDEDED